MSAPASASISAGTTGTSSCQRKEEMSEFDKGRIVGWNDEGVPKREMGRQLGRNESTIRIFLKRWVKSKYT
jgi:IS30 family transposase